MQRWDYLVVAVGMGTHGLAYSHYDWVVLYTNRRDASMVKTDANDYLSLLGAQGWDLVSSTPVQGESVPTVFFTFRRLTASEPAPQPSLR